MAKGYEDLSRRGLIKLNRDFDQENDGSLLQYLAEHGDEYENIRPVEAVIERLDQAAETVSSSGYKIKEAIGKESGNIVESIIDAIGDAVDIMSEGCNECLEGLMS